MEAKTNTNGLNEKVVNIFRSGASLKTKDLIREKSATKKANRTSFADVATALIGAFQQLVKSSDARSRNCANACKGRFKTEGAIIENCYPYQTKDGLLCKKSIKLDKDGNPIIIGEKTDKKGNTAPIYSHEWTERKVTASSIRGILREAIENYINHLYKDDNFVNVVELGADVESAE